MFRVIVFIIISYFALKIVGFVLTTLRAIFSPHNPNIQTRSNIRQTRNNNVEDVDYEDVTDKK
jgi:type IV secretory pathway VirB3-like protein